MKDKCPNCGYCEHCGRANTPRVHPRPWYPPYNPYPYYGDPYKVTYGNTTWSSSSTGSYPNGGYGKVTS